jgi:murein L,D-transpeptidase YafK
MTLGRLLLSVVLVAALAGAAGAKDLRDPDKILAKIDAIIKDDVTRWCAGKGVAYPPSAVVLRIFKKERELEIWAKNDGQEKMALVGTIPICAMDFTPGPKVIEGDGRTPEGFYHPEVAYGSRHYWMWMDLDDVDAQGETGRGSSFKMCTEYPNAVDRKRTKDARHAKTGGEICLHGNCVSAGCPSFRNRDFLPVFAFARHHDAKRHGRLQLHVFPFRLDKVDAAKRAALAEPYPFLDAVGKERVLRFWDNLQEGFDAFNKDPNPLKIGYGAGVYVFGGR